MEYKYAQTGAIEASGTQTNEFGQDVGTFEGFASTPDIDRVNDIVDTKAFEGADPKNVMLLWAHDQKQPLGRWLEFTPTTRGLRVKGELILAVEKAREAHALMRAGAVKGLSIGYHTPSGGSRIVHKTVAGKQRRIRHLSKVNLHEISICAIPANSKAVVDVESVKAADGSLVHPVEFEAWLRTQGFSPAVAYEIVHHGYSSIGQQDLRMAAQDIEAMVRAVR